MNTLKGLTLIEVLVSIVIISLLIGVLAQIMLLYNKIQREHSQLTNDTLQAKEIGIKIEKQMALSNYILIVNTSTYDWIETSKYKFQLNKNLPKDYQITSTGKHINIIISLNYMKLNFMYITNMLKNIETKK